MSAERDEDGTGKPHYDLTTWSPEDLVAEIHRLRERVHTVAAEADKRAAGWQRSVEETRALSEWAERMFERDGLPRWAHQSTLMKHWVISLLRQRDDALSSVAARVAEETAVLQVRLDEVTRTAKEESSASAARFVRLRDVLRLVPQEPGGSVGWEDVEAEVVRLRAAHDGRLDFATVMDGHRREIRQALGLPEGASWHAVVGAAAHLVEPAGPEGPCSTCHGGWTVDENWSPESPGEWDGSRSPGDGVIPCGFCSQGEWTRPWPPPDGWEGRD